jgi:hypothetical protein
MFEETNKYTETTDEKGRLRGSQKWWKLIVLEFEYWLCICKIVKVVI